MDSWVLILGPAKGLQTDNPPDMGLRGLTVQPGGRERDVWVLDPQSQPATPCVLLQSGDIVLKVGGSSGGACERLLL